VGTQALPTLRMLRVSYSIFKQPLSPSSSALSVFARESEGFAEVSLDDSLESMIRGGSDV